jgi:hypothetical protein
MEEREREDLGLSDLVQEAKRVGEQLARFESSILRNGPPPLAELREGLRRIEDAFQNWCGAVRRVFGDVREARFEVSKSPVRTRGRRRRPSGSSAR